MNIRCMLLVVAVAAWIGASSEPALAQGPLVSKVERPFSLFGNWSIPAESMVPTFLVGDRVHVEPHILGKDAYTPKRGDVVLLQHTCGNARLLKRVVGLPGDRVQMKKGRLYINGALIDRKLVRRVRYQSSSITGRVVDALEYEEQLPGEAKPHLIHEWSDHDRLDDTPELKVPLEHLFVIGDNRDNSEDSRAPSGHPDMARKQMLYEELHRGKPGDPSGWSNPSMRGPDPAIGFVPFDHVFGLATSVPFSLYECPARRPDGPPDVECLKSGAGKRL